MALIDGKQLKAGTVTEAKLAAAFTAELIRRDGSVAFTGDQAMGSSKLTGLANGTAAGDAINKGQLDAAVSGLSWQEPVAGLLYTGNHTIATLDALTPATGDIAVATDAGTPAAGTSDALVAGSIAEYDGTQWKELVAGSGGFVPAGERLLVDTAGALTTPLTNATDDGKIAEFDGSTNTPTLVTPLDGWAALIANDLSINTNNGYVFDGTVPTGTWIQFAGAANVVTAGDGIDVVAGVVSVDLAPNGVGTGGLSIVSTELAVEPGNGMELTVSGVSVKPDTASAGNFAPVSAIANGTSLDVSTIDGVGIEANGSALLQLSTQGNGIAGGGGSTLSVNPDGDSVSVGASGVKSSVPTGSDKDQTCSVTALDEDDSGAAISAAPGGDSYPKVELNGVGINISFDVGKTGEAYFAAPGVPGVSRTLATLVAGDELQWNGSVAGFELSATDRISIFYAVA